MRIEEVQVHAFGALREQRLTFPPGLVVVYGPNESGKSTWLHALYCALCGIAAGRRSSAERNFEDRYEPWDGGEWKVSCVVVLDDGRRIEAVQRLHKKSGYVTDLSNGKDVTAQFIKGRKRGMPDLTIACGVDRVFFRHVAIVPQGRVLEITRRDSVSTKGSAAEAIRTFISRAAAVSGSSESIADALRRLAEARDQLGREDRDGSKPLNVARKKLKEAQEAYERAKSQHEKLVLLDRKIKSLEEKEADLRSRRAYCEAVLKRAEAISLSERLQAAHRLVQEIPGIETGDWGTAVEASRKLAEARGELVRALDDIAEHTGMSEEEIRSRLDELAEVNPPPDIGVDPVEALASLKDLESVYRHTRDALASMQAAGVDKIEPPDLGRATPDQLSRLRLKASAEPFPLEESILRAIDEKEKQIATALTTRALSIVGVVAGVGLLIGSIVFLMKSPLLGAATGLLGLAVLAVAFLALTSSAKNSNELHKLRTIYGVQQEAFERSRREAAEALEEARSLGLPATKEGLEELYKRWQQYEFAVQSRQAIEAQLVSTRQRLVNAASSLAQRLVWLCRKAGLKEPDIFGEEFDASGELPDSSTFAALDRAYKIVCRYLSEIAEARKKYQTKVELEAALVARKRYEDALRAAQEALRKYGERSVSPGAEDFSPKELISALRKAEETLQSDFAASSDAQRRLAELTGGKSLEEFDAEVRTASDDATKAIDAASASQESVESRAKLVVSSDKALAELQSEMSACAEELEEVSRKLAAEKKAFEIQFGSEASDFVSVAEAEELLEAAEAELKTLKQQAFVLEMAAKLLGEAGHRVHNKLAPRLQKVASEAISKVTLGRYMEVFFDDETPVVRLRRPTSDGSSGPPIEAELLSYGTAEQIYLLFRLIVANEVATKDSIPMFFDESTVHTDSARLSELLEILNSAASDDSLFPNISQVVLFTQEEEVVQWAKDRLPPDNLIVLSAAPTKVFRGK